MTDRIVESVKADLDARSAKGLAKYGVHVGDNPLSHKAWLRHAYEEALNMAVYLRRAMDEQNTTRHT